MNKKIVWWLVGITAFIFIILGFILLLTRVILVPPKSWWWFFGFLIFFVAIGLGAGILFLILKLLKYRSKPEKTKVDAKTAMEKAIREKQYDVHNPDNFTPYKRRIMRVGEAGSPRTPILWLKGNGSETGNRIDAIINLDNPTKEITWIENETDKEIREAIRSMAENPESEEVQTTTTGLGQYGQPMTTTVLKKVSRREAEQKKEEAEADRANTF